MQFALDKSSKLPYYDQIKHQLTAALHLGELKHHHRLPTVRAMARSLGVNPKTILKIYHRLKDDGVLDIRVGSGVHVSAVERKNFEQNYFASLLAMADRHLDEAHRLQVPPESYLALLHELIDPHRRRKISCLVAECNTEQIQLFASEISRQIGVAAHPVLVSELHRPHRRVQAMLSRATFLITTDFHWDEVKRVAQQSHKIPFKVRLNPEFLSTLVHCARKGGILMVVSNLDFFSNFRSALRDLGYHSLLTKIHAVLASDERRLASALTSAKHVYISPLCDSRLLKRLPPHVHSVRISQHLSNESLHALRRAILTHHLQSALPAVSTATTGEADARPSLRRRPFGPVEQSLKKN